MEIIECKNIGVSLTTKIHVKEVDGGFQARCGFSLMGTTYMTDEQFKECEYNPLNHDFHDNFTIGEGKTKDEAILAIKKNLKYIADSLWI